MLNFTKSVGLEHVRRGSIKNEALNSLFFPQDLTSAKQAIFHIDLHHRAETVRFCLCTHSYTRPVGTPSPPRTDRSRSTRPLPHPPRHHFRYTGYPTRNPRACSHRTLRLNKRPILGAVNLLPRDSRRLLQNNLTRTW